MLQQILKDMYIDPDVLDALNEEQKKTLFLKMREEQVRRWKEREEKLEREGGGDAEGRRTKPKKANGKSVSWLLGRDGEVAVVVIGEMDELSSKLISTGLGGKMPATPPQSHAGSQTILKSRTATDPVRTEKENPARTLAKQGKSEETGNALPLAVSVSERSSPPAPAAAAAAAAVEKPQPPSAGVAEGRSLPQPSVCSRPPTRTGAIYVRPASASAAPGSVNTRPGCSNLRPAVASASASAPSSSSSSVKAGGGATSGTRVGPRPPEPQKSVESVEAAGSRGVAGTAEASRKAAAPEAAGSSGGVPTCAGRGRVAQLMKTFGENAAAPGQPPPRGVKPPLPNKPGHLRLATPPSVR